jgi:hypothetical protein
MQIEIHPAFSGSVNCGDYAPATSAIALIGPAFRWTSHASFGTFVTMQTILQQAVSFPLINKIRFQDIFKLINNGFRNQSTFHHFSLLLIPVFHLQVLQNLELCSRHIHQCFLSAFNTTVVTIIRAITNLQQIRLYIIRPAISTLPQSSVEVHDVFGADI